VSDTDYDIHTDDKFGHLTHIDVGAEAAQHKPTARGRTVVLMVEPATVVPTGD
jgi:hypothetical protein